MNYVKELTKKYPYKIKAHGEYEAYLVGVQPLINGEAPVYRFPGGDCVIFPEELTADKIIIKEYPY